MRPAAKEKMLKEKEAKRLAAEQRAKEEAERLAAEEAAKPPPPKREYPIEREGELSGRACAIKVTRSDEAITCDVIPTDTGKASQLVLKQEDLDWENKVLVGKDWSENAYDVGEAIVENLVYKVKVGSRSSNVN